MAGLRPWEIGVAVQPRVDERIVAGVWERQAFDASKLAVLGLRVIYRGVPSDAGGPDYQDAVLVLGDQRLVTGDVEFHVNAGDWYRHGHHLNPKYNRVILHVVWSKDTRETRRQDGVSVPVLALEGSTLPEAFTPGAATAIPLFAHPCVATFNRFSTDELMGRIRHLGSERFEQRAARFAADLSLEDADQVVYGALLEGLGYASNRRTFALLADVVPYAWLMSVAVDHRLATLLEAARLGPRAAVPPPAHLPPESWRLAMLRPANHPARRLEGLVGLLTGMAPSVAQSMIDAVGAADRPSDLRRRLMTRVGEDAFIGSGRADELVVSVMLPLVAALQPSDVRALRLFDQYPSPPTNRWTRHMLTLIQQAGHDVPRVRSAREHQGLHHLYHAFCRAGNSAACSLCRTTACKVPD